MLLDGTGGLPLQRPRSSWAICRFHPECLDGYPQRFRHSDGFFAEPFAVKQGWMPAADWNSLVFFYMSTGVIGADAVRVRHSARCSPSTTPPRCHHHRRGQDDVPGGAALTAPTHPTVAEIWADPYAPSGLIYSPSRIWAAVQVRCCAARGARPGSA